MPENKKLVSVIVPVYNEQESLPFLMPRAALRNGGDEPALRDHLRERRQRDNSLRMLYSFHEANPKAVRIVGLTAISASTWRSWPGSIIRGEKIVITLDADLQNPPEGNPGSLKKSTRVTM